MIALGYFFRQLRSALFSRRRAILLHSRIILCKYSRFGRDSALTWVELFDVHDFRDETENAVLDEGEWTKGGEII
jgi:hypothetical protein